MLPLIRSRRWTVPAVAAALIVLSFTATQVLSPLVGDGLMVAAAVVAGAGILRNAVRALLARVIGIDLLVSVAAVGAVIIGELWEAAAVTFLFAVGHALEDATLTRTRSALDELVAVAPDVAVVLRDGEQVEVPAGTVDVDETVLVKAGAAVPVDGEVLAGHAALDEASITGESIPVEKAPGDPVFAGTVSRGGLLQVRATEVGAETTLARIIRRVEEAQDAKAPTQAFMDRFSRWYTPAVLVLAAVAGLVTGDVQLALTLLVIACPGALVISIPVAVVAGIGRGARDGVLVKGGEFLETAARVDVVALDKTGTLTQGRPQLTDVVVLAPEADRAEVLTWAARAEVASEHPLARPVVDAARADGLELGALPEAVTTVPGRGVLAQVGGRQVAVGNLSLLTHAQDRTPAAADEVVDTVERLARAGRTPMVVAVDGHVLGVLGVADDVRPDAVEAVAGLHAAGMRTVMLTGDQERVAVAVAARVGITDVRAALLPEDKLDAVRALQREGHVVAMVGDGVNDAPALATADIGVAMGAAGTGVAIETADIALMSDRLVRLPHALSLAGRTVRVMRQNIVIALVTVAILVAGVLLGGVTMAIGMLVHEVSVLVVIVNAMRLGRGASTRAPRSGDGARAESRYVRGDDGPLDPSERGQAVPVRSRTWSQTGSWGT